LPDNCGERLAHFAGLSLEGDGPSDECRVTGVMEPVDVSGDGVLGLLAGVPCDRPDQLRLDGLEDREEDQKTVQ
jgi:hypothetical protein